jgi:hypothetical protein
MLELIKYYDREQDDLLFSLCNTAESLGNEQFLYLFAESQASHREQTEAMRTSPVPHQNDEAFSGLHHLRLLRP